MDIKTAVKLIKDILTTTPEKTKELNSLVSGLYFKYKDTDYRDFILSLIRLTAATPEQFEQSYLFAYLPTRKHTDIPNELFEYLRKNMTAKITPVVITPQKQYVQEPTQEPIQTSIQEPVQQSIQQPIQTPIQATYKRTLFEPPKPFPNTCIIFIRQEDQEFFKNAPSIIEKASELPIYRLNNSLFPESDIPVFNFENTTYTHAFLWTDRYYINTRKRFTTPEPFLKDNTVIGPLEIDVSLFKKHYDKIMAYDDIAYGYLTETGIMLPANSNVFTVNRKVCCSTAREMYSNTIIYIPDQGKEFLYSIDWLNDQIQGDKKHE